MAMWDDINVYHVILRGVKGCWIFKDEEDKKKFLFLCNRFLGRFQSGLYAFVLMDNHVHLLIQCAEIGSYADCLISAYTGYFCHKYSCKGRLIEIPNMIKKTHLDWQIDTLLYILNNPVMADLCKSAGGYRFSSYAFYTDRGTRLSELVKVDTTFVWNNFKNLDELKTALEKKESYQVSLKQFKERGEGFCEVLIINGL